jgi:hypothetical protein
MGWEAFEPALSRAEEMDADAVWRCAADIPKSGTKELVERHMPVSRAAAIDSKVRLGTGPLLRNRRHASGP